MRPCSVAAFMPGEYLQFDKAFSSICVHNLLHCKHFLLPCYVSSTCNTRGLRLGAEELCDSSLAPPVFEWMLHLTYMYLLWRTCTTVVPNECRILVSVNENCPLVRQIHPSSVATSSYWESKVRRSKDG